MKFDEKVYKMLEEQSFVEEYVNPNLLEGVWSGLYECGYLDRMEKSVSGASSVERLRKYISEMWSW